MKDNIPAGFGIGLAFLLAGLLLYEFVFDHTFVPLLFTVLAAVAANRIGGRHWLGMMTVLVYYVIFAATAAGNMDLVVMQIVTVIVTTLVLFIITE
ncbi:hypothetical protein [Alteribacter natronophilus]|uniref:hypothetical protein n=1 Tax=Alteribacter natronophilus TaxID=2583810 RepID=UPI00110E0D82|nr:hypothetical protein [Alteribacter natronophilus]TMW72755.1 hypothetical protein FGB90_00125 [Alteribacter natronophilus]